MADPLLAKVRNLGRGRPALAGKTSDLGRSSATLSNDPDLSVAVAANAVYRMDAWLHFTGPDSAGIAGKFTMPSGASAFYGTTVDKGGGSYALMDCRESSEFNAMTWAGSDQGIRISGSVVTASTGGNYTLQWARWQGSGTVTLCAGSWIDVRRCD
jgi:hypothetical protein